MSELDRVIDNKIIGKLRGSLKPSVSLARYTTLGVGGPAEWFFVPHDIEDLIYFLAHLPADVDILVLGNGSNLLIRDGGVPGVTVFLNSRRFREIALHGAEPGSLVVGGGTPLSTLSRWAQRASIGGFEFYSAIPGRVGGALRMNAGGYGNATEQLVLEAEIVRRDGEIVFSTADELALGYRQSQVPRDSIIARVRFKAEKKAVDEIEREMQRVQSLKRRQPAQKRTAGSTFKNPIDPDDASKRIEVWKLIRMAGCANLSVGGARISGDHANWVITSSTATASDVENLVELVREKVNAFDNRIVLEWEIVRAGVHAVRK